ncbi:MAG TPA: condensation domain-containing protein, partial [Longimicrobium sp.]|nr:condensation domain-containing protein [Longimicrobium sp.]
FALGGHSLLATRLISRIREAFTVEMPLRALFEASSVEALAQRVDALARESRGAAAPPIVPVERDRPLPLSFAQQRLWFIDQLEPGSAAYNIPYALRLRGRLDVAALERSIATLVARHEVLRTRFPSVDGEPVQVIDPAAPIDVTRIDLSTHAAAEDELRALAVAEARRPFDLATGPLFRSTLVRLGEEEHAVLFTLHHIVSDGWSSAIVVREVSELYAAFAEGRDPSLSPLPVQYADFAAWQRAWLSGNVLDAQLGYWRERLAGAPPRLELPADHPAVPGDGDRAATASFSLSAETSEALRGLSRREGATLFMTMLAGWQLLLARYGGEDDVSVGTPVAGRTRLETEGLIGFFINTLVLRTDLSGGPSFRELVRRARETTLGAYQHQDIPFEKLVEELAPERSLGHTPFFQVMFALQNAASDVLSLGGVRFEGIPTGVAAAKFDLVMTAHDGGDAIGGTLVYRAARFEAATAERMVGHYAALLRAVAAEPDRPGRAHALPGEAERRRVLEEWNATDAPAPDLLVHELFAVQAARTPDAPAVLFGAEALTYAELDARSARLAHHLRAAGVDVDDRVGLLLERSAEGVVAVLAILRAGAAYVALDPSYPDDRLHFMLADASASAAVSRSPLAERIGGFRGTLVRLDRDVDAIASRPSSAPRVDVAPENLAYVIYTSGSTGTPKGVLIEHGGLANYLAWFDREVLGDDGFALPMVSRLSFDAHVRQLFPPLLRG